MTRIINVEPLGKDQFEPFGQVIDVGSNLGQSANQGTAKRFNFLADLVNLRQQHKNQDVGIGSVLPPNLTDPPAKPNLCIFRVMPADLPFSIKLLERHKYSTQMFIPMIRTRFIVQPSYLVIVALNDPLKQQPDWSTLRVFRANSTQAFNYNPGVWHHPMVGLGDMIDFVCLVWERREQQADRDEDTEEAFLQNQDYIRVKISQEDVEAKL